MKTLREFLEEVRKSSNETGQFPLWGYLSGYRSRVEDVFESTRDIEIRDLNCIPDSGQVPFESPKKWVRVDPVACLFVDMTDSSMLDFENHTRRVAQIYEGFTTPLVRFMDTFGAAYIDIKGDGAFCLFDDSPGCVRAVLAATTFRKYIEETLQPLVDQKTDSKVSIGFRAAMTFGPVIFKRIGLRGDKKNEVWTNSTVNNCVKLAQYAEPGFLYATPNAYRQLKEHPALVHTCGCRQGDKPRDERPLLWEDIELDGAGQLGMDSVKRLTSTWCDTCGEDYINEVIEDFELDI